MLTQLKLENFRSHTQLKLELSPHTNVIIGPNGAGKTNILEAVLMIATGKSYRGSDSDTIHYNSEFSKVTGKVADRKRSIVVKSSLQKAQKSFTIGDKPFKQLSFQNRLPVVLFEPEFLQLLRRGPDKRRDYIDSVLIGTVDGYQTLVNNYRRVLAQRNALLKNHRMAPDQLFVWDIKLSQFGSHIVFKRLELLETIKLSLNETYSSLASKKHTVELSYQTSTNINDYSNALLKGLQRNHSLDIERGFTSLGPHRDDIIFSINQKNSQLYASRGEIRTFLLSLKIAELKLVEVTRNQKPLMLLDDVFSELDEARQTKLVQYFKNYQVIITSTTTTPLMKGISGKIIELN